MTTPAHSSPGRPEPAPIPWLLKEGDRIGEFTICKAIGEGSGGIVYEVMDAAGALFALKLSRYPVAAMGKNPLLTERLYQSAIAHFALLDLLNVAKIVGVGALRTPEGAFPYLVMELVPGGESITRWAARTIPTLANLVEVFTDIASTLGTLADMKIVHRDLKPQNILIAPDDVPKIVDLNSASFPTRKTITAPAASAIPGTPAYFSPELAAAVLEERRSGTKKAYAYAPTDDLYALGCVFYEVLVGEVPCCDINEPPETILTQIVREMPIRPDQLHPSIPWAITKVIMKLLKKDPAARYQSGHAVADDLRTARLYTADSSWFEPFIVRRSEPNPKLPVWMLPSATIAPGDPSADKTLPATPPPPAAPTPKPKDAPTCKVLELSASAPQADAEPASASAPSDAPPKVPLAAEALLLLTERPRRRWAAKLGIAVAVLGALVAWPIARQHCPPESSAEKGSTVLCKAKMALVAAASTTLSCVGLTANMRAQEEEYLAQCSAEARETVKGLGIENRGLASIVDGPSVKKHDYGYEMKNGPIELSPSNLDWLGGGSVFGDIEVGADGALVRLKKLKLDADGRELPVCGIAWGAGGRPGIRKVPKDDPNRVPDSELHPDEGFIYVVGGGVDVELAQ